VFYTRSFDYRLFDDDPTGIETSRSFSCFSVIYLCKQKDCAFVGELFKISHYQCTEWKS